MAITIGAVIAVAALSSAEWTMTDQPDDHTFLGEYETYDVSGKVPKGYPLAGSRLGGTVTIGVIDETLIDKGTYEITVRFSQNISVPVPIFGNILISSVTKEVPAYVDKVFVIKKGEKISDLIIAGGDLKGKEEITVKGQNVTADVWVLEMFGQSALVYSADGVIYRIEIKAMGSEIVLDRKAADTE